MIENIDENIGRLESFLRENNLRETTLLIFLTDNGSTMGPRYYNAGMKGGKVTLWEGGHRVPLFIRWPGGKFGEPRDIAELSHVQDLLPTLIDVCGLEQPASHQFDGMSLGDMLRGARSSLPDRMLVVNYSRMPFEVRRPVADHSGTPRKTGAAVLWKRWRLLEDRMLFELTSDPMQEDNVIERFPDVAMKMRAHLNQWWEGVKDTVNQPSRVVIGADAEKVTMLTACEWFDVFVDQQRQVRLAERKLGVWHLEIDQPGDYVIELRRYPRESDLAITQSIPVTKVTDGQYVAGKKMPVMKARLQISSFDKVIDLKRNARSVSFRVPLTKGACEMRTAFLDPAGEEICGAYYAYIRRD